MNLTAYVPRAVSPTQFVNFWCKHYHDPRHDIYVQNIGKPLNRQRARALICWRSRTGYTKEQRAVIEKEFLARIEVARAMPRATSAERWLEEFPRGGAMLRLFWLHIWQPRRFPLFDSHIYRASCHVLGLAHQSPSKLGEVGQIRFYIDHYLGLYQCFEGLDARKVEPALHALGLFLTRYGFPND